MTEAIDLTANKALAPPRIGDVHTLADGHRVEIFSCAHLPTSWGHFRIVAFTNDKDHREHIALIRGEPWGQDAVPTRLHSECLTGDVFQSLKCDCGAQLELAMEQLGLANDGILLYMRQEGRGIGLANKIRAYALQEQGLDTVEANEHLGFDDDIREYDIAAAMLLLLKARSIALYTNNPAKLDGLAEHGVRVERRVPIHIDANDHNRAYLLTKKLKSGHLL